MIFIYGEGEEQQFSAQKSSYNAACSAAGAADNDDDADNNHIRFNECVLKRE